MATVLGSAKRSPGMTWKKSLRMEQAVRLALDPANYSIVDIAQHLGVAPITVAQWRMTAYYQSKMRELASGVMSSHDATLRGSIETQREELEAMVPIALQGLRTLVMSKNESTKLKAIGEILDRDGKFGKVSKSSVTITPTLNTDKVDNTGMELFEMMRKFNSPADVNTDGFSVSASGAGEQVKIMDKNNESALDDLDAGSATKQ